MTLSRRLGAMNPNSHHQLWSRWTLRVLPGGTRRPSFAIIRHNAATFGRARFGSASEMRVTDVFTGRREVKIEIRSEGHPVHDPEYVAWMHDQWTRWAAAGFGPGTEVLLDEAKLEAGDRQDGAPRDQLIMLDPSIPVM
jgi:hypothetical protein